MCALAACANEGGASPLSDGGSIDAGASADTIARDGAGDSDTALPLDAAARGDGDMQSSFAAVQAIFDQRCVNCHSSTATGSPGLGQPPLTADESHDALVNQPARATCGGTLVRPGKPDESYLVHKVSDARPCEGERMPRGFEISVSPPLSDLQIATIRAWIAAGAPR